MHTSIKEERKEEIKNERNKKNNKISIFIPWNILHVKMFKFKINNKGVNTITFNIRISRRNIPGFLRVSRCN